jgi:diacylglycerol kinase (ATP)
VTEARTALLIVNPKGGRGRAVAVARGAERRLLDAGWTVQLALTQSPGHGRDLMRALEPGAFATVGVIGGDGTLREVVDGLLTDARASTQGVCLMPAGTGNALAGDLGLSGVEDAVTRLLAGAERSIDVVRVTADDGRVHHACDLVGFGLASDAARWAERIRPLGSPRYAVGSALAALFEPARSLEIQLDGGEVIRGPLDLVIASNTRRTGAGMTVAPGAVLDDGLVDVLLVRALGRLRRLALLPRLGSGRLSDGPFIQRLRTRRFQLEADTPMAANLDGDLVEGRRFDVEVLPRALRIMA